MEFTLHYRGALKSQARPPEKHEIRRHFHKQLKILWNQRPLKGRENALLNRDGGEISLIRQVRNFTFASIVSDCIHLVAELDITLLRPERPGSIIGQGGDIDNRLKTLFDALKVPSDHSDLPANVSPESGEDPFFCLLEDDRLITRVSVSTAQFLEETSDPTEVVLLIRVLTKQLEVLMKTIGL